MSKGAYLEIPPIALGQVEEVHPEDGTVSVLFPDLSALGAVRVKVGSPLSSAYRGEYVLPERGSWGLIAFYQRDARSGVWFMYMGDKFWNVRPLEVWDPKLNSEADPQAHVTYTRGNRRRIEYADSSDREDIWPDGTLLRVSHRKDGSKSNLARRVMRTEMVRGKRKSLEEKREKREAYTPPTRPPADIAFEHSSGFKTFISADGRFEMTTPKGHRILLTDYTEKVRKARYPHPIIAEPEEGDEMRQFSKMLLQTEVGHRLEMRDDPLKAIDKRFIQLESALGHLIEWRDLPKKDQRMRIQTARGQLLDMRDMHNPDSGEGIWIRLFTFAGHKLELNDKAGEIRLSSSRIALRGPPPLEGLPAPVQGGDIYILADGTVRIVGDVKVEVVAPSAVVIADSVSLGGATALQGVARIGDTVVVGGVPGIITSGSSIVKAL